MKNRDQEKPFSQACENNRSPILDVLAKEFADQKRVLELGSGTGQHAVHIGPKLPHVLWQTSDLAENIDGINQWIDAEKVVNVLRPLTIDLSKSWAGTDFLPQFDAVFSANTLHIMSWEAVEMFFQGLALCKPGTRLAIYGPFKYDGHYTSESNERFQQWLLEQEPHRGIRDFEAVDALATAAGFSLKKDYAMPANNQLIIWQK